MLIAEARRCIAALRQAEASARIARALWMAWAVVVWNVLFDHAVVAAARSYVVAAERADASTANANIVNMDDWMRPAVTRGLWTASAGAAAISVVGLLLVRAGEE